MDVTKLKPDYRYGVIQIMGPHDTGKTTAALQAGPIKDTCLIDDDVKGKQTIRGIEIGRYIDLLPLIRGKLRSEEKYPIYKEVIDKLENYQVIVWDTWSDVYRACREYGKENSKMFRDRYGHTPQMRQGEMSKDGRALELNLVDTLRQKCDLLILVTHMKKTYVNGVAVEQLQPDQSSNLDRICSLRMWLRHMPGGSGVPYALLQKRPGLAVQTEAGILRTINFLPRKVVPLEGEFSIWDAFDRYVKDPVGLRDLLPHEIPTSDEIAMLDSVLTADQREFLKIASAAARPQEIEEELLGPPAPDQEKVTAILAAKEKGLTTGEIKESLKDKYPNLTIPEILRTK